MPNPIHLTYLNNRIFLDFQWDWTNNKGADAFKRELKLEQYEMDGWRRAFLRVLLGLDAKENKSKEIQINRSHAFIESTHIFIGNATGLCVFFATELHVFCKQFALNLEQEQNREKKMHFTQSDINENETNKSQTDKQARNQERHSTHYFWHWTQSMQYLSSHLQCISVLMRQLKSPYFVSNPIIQNGHDLSCWRQQRSAFERPPSSAYFLAEYPFPHHLVPGTRSIFVKSRRCLEYRELLSFAFWTKHVEHTKSYESSCLMSIL